MKCYLSLFSLFLILHCIKAKPINVHVIAHTHDDVGWLKTVDEYYYGANNTIQDARVQYILDTVVECLLANPERKFIYVEIAYFWRWWGEQTDSMKESVRELVRNGQLEFINGGWVMNDEGVIPATDIIDQMTEGHDFLFETVGARPTIGWHIDPFGHSAQQPAIFARMGFDGFFFARIDWQDYKQRANDKNLEFVWRATKSYGTTADMFSSVLFNGTYCAPSNWDFEESHAAPIQTDPRLFGANAKSRADGFKQFINEISDSYATDNVLYTFGCDFQYSNAHINFKNMDKLMAYINSHPEYEMNVFYSTPSIYLQYLQEAGYTWSLKTDDFFPYSEFDCSYHTGYFTSRPALKGYVRTRSSLLHAADGLLSASLGVLDPAQFNFSTQLTRIQSLSQAVATAQHHDAVTGTEKQHVCDDYEERLYIGSEEAIASMKDVVSSLIARDSSNKVDLFHCNYLNVSNCSVLNKVENGVVSVILVNPLAWTRVEYVRLPVPIKNVEVLDKNGNLVYSQIELNDDNDELFTITFQVEVPALGVATYFLQPSSSAPNLATVKHYSKLTSDLIIKNEYISLTFEQSTNLWSRMTNLVSGNTVSLNQNFYWYNSSIGNDVCPQASGAYIIAVNESTPFLVSQDIQIVVTQGELYQEIKQIYADWVIQRVRLYYGQNWVELETDIGSIPFEDGLGKEVIRRFDTSLSTEEYWYSDSNGMEMQQRKKNYRSSYNFTCTSPVSCDYVPISSTTYIKDDNSDLQLTSVSDRARGCSSQSDGSLEIMMHRRLLHDDKQGVGEPLNDSTIIRTKDFIVLDSVANSAQTWRHLQQTLNQPFQYLFSPDSSVENWISNYYTSFTPLVQDLPPNVRLETFKMRPTGQVLLRLAHLFAVGEDPKLSANVTVNLQTLFTSLTPVAITEMTLSANRPLSELHRLKWKVDSELQQQEIQESQELPFMITLGPMDIRTFLVSFQ